MAAERPASWSSPIANIAQDHLFAILLLLPVDSILSFSMTCKRLRSLSCSDNLWESVCRRDWGHTSVDAFKSHHHQLPIPWLKLYKQVSLVDSVSCRQLLPHPDADSVFPCPRASHSLNFVSDCLVLFGGGCEGGRHLDDTWAAFVGNDFRRTLKWQKINLGIPSGRFGHTCVVMGDHLVLFGGINDKGIRQNDTWMGQLTFHETLGITLLWRLLDVGVVAPPPRGAHAACCVDNRKMVIHGGIGLSGLRLGDTWVLQLSESLCSGTWSEVVTETDPCPPARSGHSVTCIGGTRAILFGGRGLGYEVLNDTWLFDASEVYPKWVQIVYDMPNIAEGSSLRRVGHSATLILGGHLLIYGGEDSYRRRKDDFWVLDVNAMPSTLTSTRLKNSKGLFGNTWRRLKAKGSKPYPRSFHRACTDRSGCYLYVFGGMGDGVLQPAESSGLIFNGELFLVELMLKL